MVTAPVIVNSRSARNAPSNGAFGVKLVTNAVKLNPTAVAAVGNAAGRTWEASVIPFILRNISLLGIDTVMQPFASRQAAWDRLTTLFSPSAYEPMVTEARLADLPALAQTMLKGGIAGRVIVNPRDAPS